MSTDKATAAVSPLDRLPDRIVGKKFGNILRNLYIYDY